MKTQKLIILIVILTNYFGFTQTSILCHEILTPIKIEETHNIPTITNNADGSITLTHPEQYITDIFAKYVIYDFYQYSPRSNPEGDLFKYYIIAAESKNLINDMKQNIPSEIFSSYESYQTSPINATLIDFVNGKRFNYSRFESTSDKVSKTKEDVPNNFNLQVEFNHNLNEDLLLMESIGQTPCGYTFSVAFKGSTSIKNLQLWEVYEGISTQVTGDQPCVYPESLLYKIIGVLCGESLFSSITTIIDEENNSLIFLQPNAVFGEDTIEFKEDVLSINESFFKNVRLISSKKSPYIEFSNINKKTFSVEVFSVLGEKVIPKTVYHNNTISLHPLQQGIYLIKLTNSENGSKVFKFLK